MIVQSDTPFTVEQIEKLKEEFKTYIKTVIDLEKKICIAGMNRHFEGEQILLQSGSLQKDLWGGGIDLELSEIDCNSFINIRPRDNNRGNEIQDEQIRNRYVELSTFFFKEIL
jgi:hypothetical protein